MKLARKYAKNNERSYSNSASKVEINIIQLVTVLINSTDRLQKPYVRTQLAIAIATAAVRDQPVNACKRNSKKTEKNRTVKQMKLASYRWVITNACKEKNECDKETGRIWDIEKELMKVLDQLSIVVITTIEHSKTQYKGNSVICTIVDEFKKLKKERSYRMILISRKRNEREKITPNGVISRLHTEVKLACTEQPHVRMQQETVHSYILELSLIHI